MQEALFYISVAFSAAALVLLLVNPLWGLMAIFIMRPLVDTTWGQPLVFDLKLTEIVSSLVPLIIFFRIVFLDGKWPRSFGGMPLKWTWIICSVDAILFSALIMFREDWLMGLSVLMRHLNGVAGFYMVQAYCRNERDFLRLAWAMAIAGFFPMATGLWEGVTERHWSITVGANDVVRNIGLYHDGITIRYFSEQTLIALLLIYSLGKRSFLKTVFCIGYGLIALYVLKGALSKAGSFTIITWLVLWPILRKSVKATVGLGIGLVIACVYYAREIMDSFGFIFAREIDALQGHAERESTFAGRWEIWEEMAKAWQSLGFMDHVFGTGHMANGAHNDYLQVLFHGGYVGLGIYIVLLLGVAWLILRYALRRIDTYVIAALFVFIMWMVDTVGLVPSAYSGYQWFAWGVIGFCLRYRQDEPLRAADVSPAVASAPAPRFANLVGAA
jgi:O-antigen ligase